MSGDTVGITLWSDLCEKSLDQKCKRGLNMSVDNSGITLAFVRPWNI